MFPGTSGDSAGAFSFERIVERRDGGKHLVVDLDRFGGVLRLRQRVGDHDGHGLADIAHAVRRQHRLRRSR